MSKKTKIITACTGGCAVLFFLIYGVGIIYFSNHLFFRTIVNGINCSMLSVDETIAYLDEKVAEYTLYITGRNNFSEKIKSQDVGLQIVWDNEIKNVVERQNSFEWPLHLFKETNYDYVYTIVLDEEMLTAKIKSWEEIQNKKRRMPKNAKIGAYSEIEKQYILEPAEQGSYLIEKNVYQVVKEAILCLKSELDLEEEQCYLKPRIGDEDEKLIKTLNEMNRYVSTEITYGFGENVEILNGDIIHTWISRDNYVVKIDEEAVTNYVKELSRKYDTAYRRHDFVTVNGETITINQGHYGWWMNRTAEASELLEQIKAGNKSVRKAVYFQEAASFDAPDYGNSYVEIDLAKQHLYLWIDGKVVLESDFVSGNLTNGNATPEGIYPITYKERNVTLRGTGYASPVSYWMPFNGGIGMHDASWRKSFGGDIYKTNGSHGCINLPLEIAQQIYEQVYTGMAVICYYSNCE